MVQSMDAAYHWGQRLDTRIFGCEPINLQKFPSRLQLYCSAKVGHARKDILEMG